MSGLGRKLFVAPLAAVVLSIAGCLSLEKHEAPPVQLTSLQPVFALEPFGNVQFIAASGGEPLRIGERTFDFGISANDTSEVTYILNGRYSRFETWIGVDAKELSRRTNHAVFQVFGDGNKIFDSALMNAETPARQVGLDVSQFRELQLKVVNGGGARVRYADWGQPMLIPTHSVRTEKPSRPAYEIRGGDLVLKLDASGEMAGLEIGSSQRQFPLSGGTRLVQCRQVKPPQVQKLPNGGISAVRTLEDHNGNKVCVTDRFTPTTNSIRWDVDIVGEGKPWSTAIVTGLKWPATSHTKYWEAWSDPELAEHGRADTAITNLLWHDPLETRALVDSSRWFGGDPIRNTPTPGDYFSLPLITITEPDSDTGFSLVHSPEDTLLQMKLVTAADGAVEFQHRCHRLGGNQHVRFSLDLVSHPADWRSGLAWMTKRYPDYFEPANPKAYAVGGCGAYSSWEGDLEADKFKKMAFSLNWKASFDFPYMGMFLPPVEEWETFGASARKGRLVAAERPFGRTSRKLLKDYSRQMREHGFHVLNYFNVTEFGAAVKSRAEVNWSAPEQDCWTNCTDFLHRKIADGIFYNEKGGYYGTWRGAVVMDCAASNYQKFLLKQAQMHIDLLPDSSGICIDRLDWLRCFNTHADDGITWYEDKPARSLLMSWKGLIDKLGPMMHENDKVIFGNPLASMRLDVLHQVDGIYSEFSDTGPALNSIALLSLFRPAVAWATSEKSLGSNPNIFFQRFLLLGVFPTAPFPGNDHSFLPGGIAERWYLAYGPLFNELKGRKWVLDAGVLKVQDNMAKANIFEVARGYAIPVVLADPNTREATIKLRSRGRFATAGDYKFAALHPGIEAPVALEPSATRDGVKLRVPLHNGCALVRITTPSQRPR